MNFLISHTCFSGFTYCDPLYRQRHKAHARVPRVATAHAALASAAAPSPKKLTARRPRTSRHHLAGHTMRPLGTRPLSSPRGSLEHHLCAVARAAWVRRDRLVGFVSAQPWPYGQVYRGRAYSPGNLHTHTAEGTGTQDARPELWHGSTTQPTTPKDAPSITNKVAQGWSGKSLDRREHECVQVRSTMIVPHGVALLSLITCSGSGILDVGTCG